MRRAMRVKVINTSNPRQYYLIIIHLYSCVLLLNLFINISNPRQYYLIIIHLYFVLLLNLFIIKFKILKNDARRAFSILNLMHGHIYVLDKIGNT